LDPAVQNYEPITTFAEGPAGEYDDLHERGDEDATVAFLEELAGGGPALELAIGTSPSGTSPMSRWPARMT
jgi:hypothetical protein